MTHLGVPHEDQHLLKVHFLNPSNIRGGAACGRPTRATLRVDEVDCPDCIEFLRQHVQYYLDRAEAIVARLLEIEDLPTP